MENQKLLSKIKILLPASLLLMTSTAFSQAKQSPTKNNQSRSEVVSKQLHSTSLGQDQGLYAEGIKLKIDMSVLEEAKAAREEAFDPDAIPADDIYCGVWMNRHVNVYGSVTNVPDSFLVDLSNFSMPHEGYVTSNFGRRGRRRYHYGIDLKVNVGDTIYAAFDGKVRVKEFERRGYGYYLVVRHLNGLETVYGHLSKFLVAENEFVKSGQPIALGGSTGLSTGPHLHFETRFLGKPINPNFIIDFDNKVCHRDEYLVTNSSYHKTTKSSSVRKTNSKQYAESQNTADNKYVSGQVKYHKIQKGDTLGAIARRYGLSVSKLCNLNNMTSRTTLRVGKSIRIS